jgi:hypothetical protein
MSLPRSCRMADLVIRVVESDESSKPIRTANHPRRAWYRAGKAIAAQIAASYNLPSRHSSTESRCGSMTDENDRQKRSNFSEVGLAFLDGPA